MHRVSSHRIALGRRCRFWLFGVKTDQIFRSTSRLLTLAAVACGVIDLCRLSRLAGLLLIERTLPRQNGGY
jgi:hypothetical protein